MASTNVIILNRYTQLPVLLDYLEREKLVLLDPKSWEDKNDSLIIEEYKKRASVKYLFALCFVLGHETIHHWKTFSNGSSGCCIEFDAVQLINIFNNDSQLLHGQVKYKKINESKPGSFALGEIPFIKRLPYKLENEYRVIWRGNNQNNFEINVPINIVQRITFSQQMPIPVFETVKSILMDRYPSLKRKIFMSTLYENKTWINNFRVIQ
ncbi:MAG: hypothetical protein IPM48_10715 [Saprospiraceae bacterium]|nr:hypothetical protein [Saprospiraceae bacterium]